MEIDRNRPVVLAERGNRPFTLPSTSALDVAGYGFGLYVEIHSMHTTTVLVVWRALQVEVSKSQLPVRYLKLTMAYCVTLSSHANKQILNVCGEYAASS